MLEQWYSTECNHVLPELDPRIHRRGKEYKSLRQRAKMALIMIELYYLNYKNVLGEFY